MREQRSGSIINISMIAAICSSNILVYKASKAGVNALTHQIAMDNARYNIRATVIMPGLMNMPMAIEGLSKSRGIPKDELIHQRAVRVPLGEEIWTAWDVAFAALFLASEKPSSSPERCCRWTVGKASASAESAYSRQSREGPVASLKQKS